MFSRIKTQRSTDNYLKQIEQLKKTLRTADAVVIGAGAGLSASAGFSYSGERFEKYFSDFSFKYGFLDMYSDGFYPFASPEEYWAYWSRYVLINRYMDAPRPVYQKLLEAVRDKDYFVITTNVDHCFQKAGFDKKRLFYTQGDYGLLQCCKPCHQETYDNEAAIIKYPFWQMTSQNPDAVYVCINRGQAACPQEIERQAICIDEINLMKEMTTCHIRKVKP